MKAWHHTIEIVHFHGFNEWVKDFKTVFFFFYTIYVPWIKLMVLIFILKGPSLIFTSTSKHLGSNILKYILAYMHIHTYTYIYIGREIDG